MTHNSVVFTDSILQRLHDRVTIDIGPIEPIIPAHEDNYFERMVESIVSQQLSVKVADIIFARLKTTITTDFTPENILLVPHDTLRQIGLSNAKATYVKNIADAWTNGLVTVKTLRHDSDEDVIKTLTQIKGVGRWTAEMFLIFTLARSDVFSVGDYGLKKAISLAYDLPVDSQPSLFTELAEKWAPHRSLASRILWRSLELK